MFTMLANLSYNDDVCGYYNVWTPGRIAYIICRLAEKLKSNLYLYVWVRNKSAHYLWFQHNIM